MRLLFVTARSPWPGRRGDQARTAGLVETLSPRHSVRVLTASAVDDMADAVPEGIDLRGKGVSPADRLAALARLGLGEAVGLDPAIPPRPLQAALYRRPALERWVARQVREFCPDAVVLMLSRLGDLLPIVAAAAPRAAIVVDLIDALSANMARRAEREPWAAPLWRLESRRLASWDVRVATAADAASVVAERDRQAILASAAEPAVLARRLAVVPFGLRLGDAPHLAPADLVANAERVVLSGNLGYFPTVEGAHWFAAEIWPRVRSERPTAEWLLAGARPARSLRQLVRRTPGARLVADPADLAALRRTARVAIAPLRAGSGTQIKILEAIADGLPVVTTPAGAEGLDGLAGVSDASPIPALADPVAFAEAVSERLAFPLGGRSAGETLGAATPESQDPRSLAWRWLRSHHALEASASRFETLLERAVARRRRWRRPGSGVG